MAKKFSLFILTCLCATLIWSRARQRAVNIISDSTGTLLARANGNFKMPRDKNDAVLMSHLNYHHALNSLID